MKSQQRIYDSEDERNPRFNEESQHSSHFQNHNSNDNHDSNNSPDDSNSNESSSSNKSKTKKTKKIQKQKKNQTKKDGQRFVGNQVKQTFTIEQDLRMVFITFFSLICQPHGLVFQTDTRRRLKLMHKIQKVHFTEEVTYDPQVQKTKIQRSISKLSMINSLVWNKAAVSQVENKLHSLYSQASFIFCPQSTFQLYSIFTSIINILTSKESQIQIQKQLRLFGDKICSPNSQFFFFGFKFVNPTKNDGKKRYQLDKKDKDRYTLKDQFRRANGKYADMVVKCAQIIKRELQLLECGGLIGLQ